MISTRRTTARITGTAVMLLAFAGLAGCAGNTEAAPAPVTTEAAPATTPAEAAPAESEEPKPEATNQCGEIVGEAVMNNAVDEVPKPSYDSDIEGDTSGADYSTFDGCAGLSWVVLTPVGGTGSSPNQIALFNEGTYIGTATKIAYGFEPEVTRIEDNQITVTWVYPEPGDANADPNGRATATFTYNEDTKTVDMTGDVPPDGRE